jgi:hypothetical protein
MSERRILGQQIHSLSADVLLRWLERGSRDDVHADSEEFFKVLEQADVIKKRCAWLEVHEQIQIAVRASLSPGNGAEHRDPARPPLLRNAQDLYPAAPQPLQRQRVIDHDSSVSSRTANFDHWRRVPRRQPLHQPRLRTNVLRPCTVMITPRSRRIAIACRTVT